MRVKMLVDIAGHWVDTEGALRDWVGHGHEMDVPREVGADLVRLGHAVEVALGLDRDPEPAVEAPVPPPLPLVPDAPVPPAAGPAPDPRPAPPAEPA